MGGPPVKVVPKSSKWWDNYDKVFGKNLNSSGTETGRIQCQEPNESAPPTTMTEQAPIEFLNIESDRNELKARLIGRTIVDLQFADDALRLVLDNDTVFTPKLEMSK